MKKAFLLSFIFFAVLLNVIPYSKLTTVCPKRSAADYQELCTGTDKWGLNKNLSSVCDCGVLPGLAVGFPNTVFEGDTITGDALMSVANNSLLAIFPALLITGSVLLFKKFKQGKQRPILEITH